MLSIIIPTLNEEDYLPKLLDSIKNQNPSDYEVIVADGGSDDNTLNIIAKYKCISVAGGSPARGRNNGAFHSKGDILFFVDADAVLPEKFFKKSLEEFHVRNLDVASFCLRPYPENRFEYFLINLFYNKMIVFLENLLPHAAMGIIAKKEVFSRAKGFDESIKLSEDHDFARRTAKFAKFGIIKSTEILTSTRRFKKDSWVITGIKFFLCQLHMIFIGPVRSNIFNYKFDHYKDKK